MQQSPAPVVDYDGAGVEGRRGVGDCVVSAAEAGESCRRIFKCSRGTAVLDYPDFQILELHRGLGQVVGGDGVYQMEPLGLDLDADPYGVWPDPCAIAQAADE